MNCEDAKGLFLAYRDGDLSETESAAVASHIKECSSCAADWDAYNLTLNEVSGMFSMEAPEDFALKVKQTIGKRSRGRFFAEDRSIGISFAMVSFLLILVFLLAYLYLGSSKKITLLSPSGEPTDTTGDTAAP